MQYEVTAEEAIIIERMRADEVSPYEKIANLRERVEDLEDIIREVAYAHDNIKCLQTDISSYIRKM